MRHFSKPHQYYSILSQHNTNTTITFQYYLNITSTLHKRFQYYSILQKRPVNTTSILHCTFWTSILLNTTNTTEVQYYKIINTTQYYQYYQYVWGQLADAARASRALIWCMELSASASRMHLGSMTATRRTSVARGTNPLRAPRSTRIGTPPPWPRPAVGSQRSSRPGTGFLSGSDARTVNRTSGSSSNPLKK